MNENEFATGSVPVMVAARIYGKDASWVRAGIISGWLPIGKATRNGQLVTKIEDIVGLWMSVGYNMIILLAGMQGISKSYYEAAQIDGAGPIQLFFKVTIPLLTPTIFFVMITSIISGFQVFDVIYMMIGKTNPAYANTQTVVMLFYRQAFDYGYKGYAAAISILIFAVIMLVTVIQMIGQKKWVNYD